MNSSAELNGGLNEKDPAANLYRDGRFAVLHQIPIDALPPVAAYEPPLLEDAEANQAGSFMQYAIAASEYLEMNTPGHGAYSHLIPERADPLIGFEYNGIRIAVEVRHFRGQPEYTFINMQRGDEIRFTLAEVEGFLTRPDIIEYLRGFAGYVESDDPLSILSRDSEAEATIETIEELGHLVRLEARDVHLSSSPNLYVAPSTTKMVIYVAKLARQNGGGLALGSKVIGEKVTPATQAFDTYTIEEELRILTQSHPNLRRTLLDSIDMINLDDMPGGRDHEGEVLGKLINTCKVEIEASTTARDEDIRGDALELASKIDLRSNQAVDVLYAYLTQLYGREADVPQRELFVQAIEIAMPQLRTRICEWLRERSVDVPEDTSTEWFLSRAKDVDAMTYLARALVDELEYNGKDPALVSDVVTIFRQYADDPDRALTGTQLATLTAAGIRVDLLPLALQEASADEGSTPLFLKMGYLFCDEQIERRATERSRDREIDEQLSHIADFVDTSSLDLLKALIKKGSTYENATATKTEELVAELVEVAADRRKAVLEAGMPLEPLTQIDIAKLLASKMKPGFETLFASDHVDSITIDNGKITFSMKPGTAPSQWQGPNGVIPIKHKIISSEDAHTIILTYQSIKNLSVLQAGEFDKAVGASASSNDDGSFVVTVNL